MAKELNEKEATLLRHIQNLEGRDKHIFSILSFVVVVLLTIIFYLIPDYYFLQKLTSDVAFQILKLYRFDVKYDGIFIEYSQQPSTQFIDRIIQFFSIFDAHGGRSPVIKDLTISHRFAIVRACTGMQAGALLLALIVVTPTKMINKLKATAYVIITLVLTNFLRIALVIGMTVTLMVNYGVQYEAAWMWSHDVLGKPIGFFGTILFAFIIEGQNVPILNTVSLWIDSLIDIFSSNNKKGKKKTK